MNFEDQMNAMNGNPILQAIFLNSLLYQQQLFQYMIQQNQSAMKPEIKEENNDSFDSQNDNRKIQKVDWLIQPQVIDTDQPTNPKEHSDDEDSSARVNGHWSKQEHELYLQFVSEHEEILKSKYDKKSKKIFKLMSQFIPTRTATQCRSHHQKFNPLLKNKKKGKSCIRPIPSVIIN